MLEQIKLKNFQCHSELLIDLQSQIVTVIGPSDVGKSAILRAIRWVASNMFVDDLIKEGTSAASAELVVDGQIITRDRSKSENTYKLDGEVFRAFGVNVPATIADILRVGDLNFQGQHDPVFWFQASAGEVSRQLNAVVDLGVIDKALGEIGGKVRAAQTASQVSQDRLKNIKAKRKDLDWVLEADRQYQIVERFEKRKTDLGYERIDLDRILLAAKKARDDREQAIALVKSIRAVGMLGKTAKDLNEKIQRFRPVIERAQTLAKTVNSRQPDVSGLVKWFDRCQKASNRKKALRPVVADVRRLLTIVDQVLPDISPLQMLVEKIRGLGSRRRSLRNRLLLIQDQVKFANREIADVPDLTTLVDNHRQVSQRRRRLIVLMKAVKAGTVESLRWSDESQRRAVALTEAMGGLCPVCGSESTGEEHGH